MVVVLDNPEVYAAFCGGEEQDGVVIRSCI